MEQQLRMGFPRAVPGKHRAPLQACRRSSQLHTAGGHRGAGFLVHSQYWRIQVLVPGYLLALLWITAGSACNRSSEAPGGNPTRRAHSPAAPGDRSALPKRSARLLVAIPSFSAFLKYCWLLGSQLQFKVDFFCSTPFCC